MSDLRTVVADVLAEHWWAGADGCSCGKQNGVEWTFHAADVILKEVEQWLQT
jgi:hypothetical protein